MLTIKKSQMQVFQKIALSKFCDEMRAHLRKRYAKQLYNMGNKTQQLKWIEKTIEEAKHHHIIIKGDLVRYLNVAIIFGKNFDQLPWAKNILNNNLDSSTRTRMLVDAVDDELKKRLKAEEKNYQHLIKIKINNYIDKNLNYVYSFTQFYGLPFHSLEDVKPWLETVTRNAVSYNIVEDLFLDAYLETAMRFGPAFDKAPWADKILNNEQNIHTKISDLLTYLDEHFAASNLN